MVNASLAYFDEDQGRIDKWLMILNVLVGIYAILNALLVQTDLMGTASKVVVNNGGILLKSKAFSSGQEIKWEEIQSITFHSYQLDFKLETAPVFFNFKSSSKVSRAIKEAIRDMADLKGITVIGG